MEASRKSSFRKHLGRSGLRCDNILGGIWQLGTHERPDAGLFTGAEREAEFGRLLLAAVQRRDTRQQ